MALGLFCACAVRCQCNRSLRTETDAPVLVHPAHELEPVHLARRQYAVGLLVGSGTGHLTAASGNSKSPELPLGQGSEGHDAPRVPGGDGHCGVLDRCRHAPTSALPLHQRDAAGRGRRGSSPVGSARCGRCRRNRTRLCPPSPRLRRRTPPRTARKSSTNSGSGRFSVPIVRALSDASDHHSAAKQFRRRFGMPPAHRTTRSIGSSISRDPGWVRC